jgi:hypothetical protein
MDDLWAILDDQQPFSTEHGRTPRSRRPSEGEVVSELRRWLLHDFVAAYCRSLAETRIFRRCYWIDGLGVNARSVFAQEASNEPIAAAPVARKGRKSAARLDQAVLQPVIELAQTLALESKPITLRGLVLTAGSSKRKAARSALHTHQKKLPALPEEGGLIRASWLDVADMLFAALAQSPAIFLLNPLGAATFSYDDLSSLAQRTVPTELCLFIPHKQIEVILCAARRSPTQASRLTELLRSDRWKTLLTGDENLTQAVDGWLELFMAAIQRYFQLPVQAIPLLARTGPAAVERVPYTLVFATRRQDSLICMNDAVYQYRLRLTQQSWQGVLSEDWFVRQQQQRWQEALQKLAQRLLEQGRAQRTRRWPDLRQQLLLGNFGQFRKQDYDMLIQRLLLDKEVRCEWKQRPAASIKAPGNEDTLLWR